jgi:hypothetical protein
MKIRRVPPLPQGRFGFITICLTVTAQLDSCQAELSLNFNSFLKIYSAPISVRLLPQDGRQIENRALDRGRGESLLEPIDNQ